MAGGPIGYSAKDQQDTHGRRSTIICLKQRRKPVSIRFKKKQKEVVLHKTGSWFLELTTLRYGYDYHWLRWVNMEHKSIIGHVPCWLNGFSQFWKRIPFIRYCGGEMRDTVSGPFSRASLWLQTGQFWKQDAEIGGILAWSASAPFMYLFSLLTSCSWSWNQHIPKCCTMQFVFLQWF